MSSPSTTPPQVPEEAVEALMKRRIVETHGTQYTSLHGFAKFQRERPADTKLLRELAEDDARVLAPALRKQGAEEERERLREAMQAKIREAERRIAGETPKDRRLRLRELLGSDWPVVTLMRDAGGKSSPPWSWWMEDDGYNHDKYEAEEYVPRRNFDQALAKVNAAIAAALDTPAPSESEEGK